MSEVARRITVMLDEDLEKKLRKLQAQLIKDSVSSVSFSAALNIAIEKGLEKC